MAGDEQFLGRGWGFPVTFGNQGRSVVVAEAEEDIRQSLEILLSTRVGERVLNPTFGWKRDALVFEPLSTSFAAYLAREIETAILFFESRIELNRVNFDNAARPGRPGPDPARLHGADDEHADQSRLSVLRRPGHQRMTTDLFRRYGNLLRSDGTNQLQRLLPALEADYIVPDERSLSDLVEYARRVAAEIRFYDLSGQATGDWRPFLELLLDPATSQVLPSPQLEAVLDTRADWPPHLVLFLVFLKLFQNLQGDLNQLTEKHLRHYYEKRARTAAPGRRQRRRARHLRAGAECGRRRSFRRARCSTPARTTRGVR